MKAFELELPACVKGFWSHNTTHQAGVGLLTEQAFLDKFNPVDPSNSDDWEEVDAGRVAVLRLRGPSGGVDIFVLYVATGEDAGVSRASAIQKISAVVQERTETLSIIMGDFNYVPSERDRINKHNGEWTGLKGAKDEEEFSGSVSIPYQMHELEQKKLRAIWRAPVRD